MLINKKACRRIESAALTAVLLFVSAFSGLFATAAAPDKAAAPSDTPAESETAHAASSWGEPSIEYAEYLAEYQQATREIQPIVIEAGNYIREDPVDVQILTDYEGNRGETVLLPETGSVSWHFTVECAGMYHLKFDYFTGSGDGNAILRDIRIDGALPFSQSAQVSFAQPWEDAPLQSAYDAAGNAIRPKQQMVRQWTSAFASDPLDGSAEPLEYYFAAGEHTLTLVARQETMLLRRITLCREEAAPSYEEMKQKYAEMDYPMAPADGRLTWEAEQNATKSDKTLYPLADRTSPSVSPYHAGLIRYNSIGGSQWQTPGQWIEWEIDVKQSGLYHIAAHGKQALKADDLTVRKLTIDGKLPFAEAADLSFAYSSRWQNTVFGNSQGEPYLFYLAAGKHTIRLTVTLGSGASIVRSAKAVLAELNQVYRDIVVVTGANPDKYRDYQLSRVIPDTLEDMAVLSDKLKALETDIRQYNQIGGQSVAAIQRLYMSLDTMYMDEEAIPQCLTGFKENISSFGTWFNNLTQQPLELDSLTLLPPGAECEKGEAGFFRLLVHYCTQFLYSFVTDYSAIGVAENHASSQIRVWTVSGRDQAQILKQLINDRFTPEKGISVDLQLVSATALLPSVVAGTSPDVFMGIQQAEPVNMAMREALTDISALDGFEEIADRFLPETLIPYQFNGGVYGLPETLNYPMLFYRRDILAQLGIEKSQLDSWDTILNEVLPELQVNSLMFGVTANNLAQYVSFLYQEGGSLYLEDGKKSGLGTAEAIAAMERYTILYTQYGLPLAFDFANRFRTGELPLGITDFTMYNQLMVFAPEIKGLWGMLPVPFYTREDGTKDRSAVATTTASVILSNSRHVDEAWDFLKWWSSTEVQSEYSAEIESVIGAAARYNSANIDALKSVQWDWEMEQNLTKQLESVKAMPEVPGGYFTPRNFDFAFRDIVYNDKNIRQTMLSYAKQIDREIQNKREEYNLD